MKYLKLVFKIAAMTLISIGLFSCSSSKKSSSSKKGEEMHKEMMKKHMQNATTFKVKITDVSHTKPPVPLSPPVLAVHKEGVHVFTVGEAAGPGLETLAEDGFPVAKMKGKNLPPSPDHALVNILKKKQGVYSVKAKPNPHGKLPALEPSPNGDGESVTIKIKGAPGDRLSLATMFVQSNDMFYGFGDDGLALFHNGQPISGDVTDKVVLYDAGTEVDEKPGKGPHQKPRQGKKAMDVGKDEHGVVQVVVAPGADGGSNNGFNYPATNKIIRVNITPVK